MVLLKEFEILLENIHTKVLYTENSGIYILTRIRYINYTEIYTKLQGSGKAMNDQSIILVIERNVLLQ